MTAFGLVTAGRGRDGHAAPRLAVVLDKFNGISDDFAVDSGHPIEWAMEFVEEGRWREPFHLADCAEDLSFRFR